MPRVSKKLSTTSKRSSNDSRLLRDGRGGVFNAQADLLDDCVAGRLHRWAGWRDRLVGARRGAVSIPHPAGAGGWCVSLRTAAIRNDGLLGDRRGESAGRGAGRVRSDLEGLAEG